MTETRSNTALKILTGILAVALIALGIYTVKFYNEEKENKIILQKEKAVIEDELNDLIIKYDEAIATNQVMDQNLVDARQRIAVLLDSVKGAEANLVLISRYRREINSLRNEKDRLFRVVDSLSMQNRLLASTIDSTNMVLAQRVRQADSLSVTNQNLSTKVDRAAQLKVTNLKGDGVIVRNNGKLVTNNRTRRIDQIRTCFTITENPLAPTGERNMYVQVYNPQNELVGEQLAVNHEGGVMIYSATSRIYYENEELDVCILANTDRDKLTEGNYKVYVYAGQNLIGTSSFDLR